MLLSSADISKCLRVAALAYDYVAEKQNPAKDPTMLRVTWERLEKAADELPVDLRAFLSREAGR